MTDLLDRLEAEARAVDGTFHETANVMREAARRIRQLEASSWPEQDAIDAWFETHHLHFPHPEVLKLKEAVTKPRIGLIARISALQNAGRDIYNVIDNIYDVESDCDGTRANIDIDIVKAAERLRKVLNGE